MNITLSHRVRFCAAIRLWNDSLPEEENRRLFGICAQTHGHNYVLEATLRGPLDPRTGMIHDLKELDAVLREEVVARCDHRDVSRDLPELRGRVVTTEVLAAFLFEAIHRRLPKGLLESVRLFESDSSFVTVRGDLHGHLRRHLVRLPPP